MKTLHELTSEEKLEHFGYGEWVEEPDEAYWEYKGIECKILRTIVLEYNGSIFGGNLRGYIKIPESHSWYDKNVFREKIFDNIDCHGGLTYGEMESDGFWLGFDCAHYLDLVPSMKVIERRMINEDPICADLLKSRDEYREEAKKRNPCSTLFFEDVYRNFAYVQAQCESLVDQMLKVTSDLPR